MRGLPEVSCRERGARSHRSLTALKITFPAWTCTEQDNHQGLPFPQQLCPASWLRLFCKCTGRDRSLTSAAVHQRSLLTLCALPRDKSYQRMVIAENRVLSYCKLLKQQLDRDWSGGLSLPSCRGERAHLLRRFSPQPKPLGNHLMDLPLAIFLPHTLIAGQARLLPGRELVAAGRSDTEELVSLQAPSPEDKGQRGSGPWLDIGGLVPPQVTSGFKVVGALPQTLRGEILLPRR